MYMFDFSFYYFLIIIIIIIPVYILNWGESFDTKIKRNKNLCVCLAIKPVFSTICIVLGASVTMWKKSFLIQLGKFSFQFSNNNNITQYLFEEHNNISLSAFYCVYRPNDRFNACLFSEQRGREMNNL